MITNSPKKRPLTCPHCHQQFTPGQKSASREPGSQVSESVQEQVASAIQAATEQATQMVVADAMQKIIPVLEKVEEAMAQWRQEAQTGAADPHATQVPLDDLLKNQKEAMDRIKHREEQIQRRLTRFQGQAPGQTGPSTDY